MEPIDRMLLEEIRARRDVPDLDQRDDILSLLLQARHEDGQPDERQGAAGRADDPAGRGSRDHGDRPGVGNGAAGAATPTSSSACADEVAAGEDDYLDAVTKETLRLRPVLPIVVRRLTQPLEIGGRLLPAGVAVAPCIYLVHRRPDIYPEPERFLPERFLERPAGTYTWIPFGGGVRRCLGASFALFEMKTVLSRIVARTG